MALLSNLTGPPDENAELTRSLQARQLGAFEELLRLYQGPIYGFVYRLLDDPADAPDVTQEIFLKVFRKINGFRGECSLKTWIYRIAVHEASNRRRWFSRWRRNETSMDHDEVWGMLSDPGDTPYESLQKREQRDLVDAALRGVDERLRSAVVLRDLQGLSYNEIAETLEISLGTVKSRILRGREALKERLVELAADGALPGVSYQPE